MKKLSPKRIDFEHKFATPFSLLEAKVRHSETYGTEGIHTHRQFEMIYMLKGSAQIKLKANQSIQLRPSDYAIIYPYDDHAVRISKECESEFIKLLFFIHPAYPHLIPRNCSYIHFAKDDQNVLLPYIELIKKQIHQNPLDFTQAVNYTFNALMFSIKQIQTETKEAANYSAKINKAFHYIKNNFTEPISLEQLAEMVALNPQYLSNLFSQEVGQSITSYLQYLRCEKACHYLATSQESLSDIAEICGFTSVTTFSRQFKAHTQLTPLQYRKQTL